MNSCDPSEGDDATTSAFAGRDAAVRASNHVDPSHLCQCCCWHCTARGTRLEGQQRTVRTWRRHRLADETLLRCYQSAACGRPPPLLQWIVEHSELRLLNAATRSQPAASAGVRSPSPQRAAPSDRPDSPSPSESSSSFSSRRAPTPPILAAQSTDDQAAAARARHRARIMSGLDEDHIGADLLAELLDDWVDLPLPLFEPANSLRLLSRRQLRTLRQYRRWLETKQTVAAWRANACTFREERVPLLSLRRAERLMEHVTGLSPVRYDMCVNSCVAFVGEYRNHDHCPFVRTVDGVQVPCGQRRFKKPRFPGDKSRRPRRQFVYVPLLDRLRAMFLNPSLVQTMQYRHQSLERLREVQASDAWDQHVFRDVADGLLHLELAEDHGLFQDARDVAVAISTDGGQLVGRSDDSAWFITASIANVPPQLRFKRGFQHVLAIIPGPKGPGDIDSFFFPLREEMARLAKGENVWDAQRSEWFKLKGYLTGVYADQPGSGKVNKMTGVHGYRGCRFCLIRACYAKDYRRGRSNRKSTPYFPLRTPRTVRPFPVNRGRPARYRGSSLPLRTPEKFAEQLLAIESAPTIAQRKLKITEYGVQALPKFAFSPAFVHPWFYPLDVFHLFSYNTFELIWDTIEAHKSLDDPDVLTSGERRDFGALVDRARRDLPGPFGKAPRDPDKKNNSRFKMVEWIAVFHYYIGPYLHALGSDTGFLYMLLRLLDGISVALRDDGLTLGDVRRVRAAMTDFCTQWEELFIGDNRELLDRARISIHLLLHVADSIPMLGSLRATSQAGCERTIGAVKRDLRNDKDRYATLVRRTLMTEQGHLLDFVLGKFPSSDSGSPPIHLVRLCGPARLNRLAWTPQLGDRVAQLLAASRMAIGEPGVTLHKSIRIRRGKSDILVRSKSGVSDATRRLSSRVAALQGGALNFYDVEVFVCWEERVYAVAYPFCPSHAELAVTHHWVGGRWSRRLELVDVADIYDVVGQFEPFPGRTYLFPRKTSMGGFQEWWAIHHIGRRDPVLSDVEE